MLVERHPRLVDRTRLLSIGNVVPKLKVIRDKTHFHLDPVGVVDPLSIWRIANITWNEIDAALSDSFETLRSLYRHLVGRERELQEYDDADAKLIAAFASQLNQSA